MGNDRADHDLQERDASHGSGSFHADCQSRRRGRDGDRERSRLGWLHVHHRAGVDHRQPQSRLRHRRRARVYAHHQRRKLHLGHHRQMGNHLAHAHIRQLREVDRAHRRQPHCRARHCQPHSNHGWRHFSSLHVLHRLFDKQPQSQLCHSRRTRVHADRQRRKLRLDQHRQMGNRRAHAHIRQLRQVDRAHRRQPHCQSRHRQRHRDHQRPPRPAQRSPSRRRRPSAASARVPPTPADPRSRSPSTAQTSPPPLRPSGEPPRSRQLLSAPRS